MNNLIIFNPNLPGVRFETTTNSLNWSEAREEIRTALQAKGIDDSILDTTNAFLADNNTQLNSESTLPSSSLIRIVLATKKNINSGLERSYNELRAEAKRLGITGLGSNPTKDDLIAAINTVNGTITNCSSTVNTTTIDIPEETNSNEEVIQRITSYIEVILDATHKISEGLSNLTIQSISPEAQAALEIVEKENTEMLNLCAKLSVVK